MFRRETGEVRDDDFYIDHELHISAQHRQVRDAIASDKQKKAELDRWNAGATADLPHKEIAVRVQAELTKIANRTIH